MDSKKPPDRAALELQENERPCGVVYNYGCLLTVTRCPGRRRRPGGTGGENQDSSDIG